MSTDFNDCIKKPISELKQTDEIGSFPRSYGRQRGKTECAVV